EDRSGVLTKSIDQVDVYSIRPKDRRKDTAAYASSSFFTCQRAASEDAVSEDNSASLRIYPA
ncbi:hypothetical protein, partial [Microvirga makkahensis]|uniref:hypothetical protein n=1 Tax=Microvirga makkahensis TaxID=1128670 RepID=UPI00197B7B70